MGLEITLGRELTSVVGVLRGARRTPAPAVLLRADMDALPVTEETGEPFAAPPGVMHACGHDLHTAALVGAAMLLSRHRDELAGDVVFMFQPGEEGHERRSGDDRRRGAGRRRSPGLGGVRAARVLQPTPPRCLRHPARAR